MTPLAPRRILLANEESQIAGAETCLIQILEGIDREQYTPVVASPTGPLSDVCAEWDVQHIPFTFRRRKLRLGTPFESRWRPPDPIALLQKFREGFKLRAIIRRHGIDLVHSNSLSAHIAGRIAATLTGRPIVWHIHQFWPRWLYRLPKPSAYVFVSEAVRDQAFGSAYPVQTRVVHNGIDLDRYLDAQLLSHSVRAEFGIAPDTQLVVTVGRLDPVKRYEDLLHAWAHVSEQHPYARLLIVGDSIGPAEEKQWIRYKDGLAELTDDLNITNSVVWAGWRADVPQILHEADIFAFTSIGDSSGLAVMEAMATGLPVIAARAGGVQSLIDHGRSGLLVDPCSPPQLARELSRLITDAELRKQLGNHARQDAQRLFSSARFVEDMSTVYDQLLGRA